MEDDGSDLPEITSLYTDAHGRTIKVVQPWGLHSGNIPPPRIDFSSGSFVYQGEELPGS